MHKLIDCRQLDPLIEPGVFEGGAEEHLIVRTWVERAARTRHEFTTERRSRFKQYDGALDWFDR
jgi:hypothetical protein